MVFEVEAQEVESLLRTEPPAAGRVTRWSRVATALSATALLALGGKVAWQGGLRVSEEGIIGANGACSDNGASCSESLCCNDGSSRCFRKNAHWSSCNQTCESNMLWVHGKGWEKQDEKVWDCHQLSAAEDGEDCTFSRKCADQDSHCYRKNEHWASCNKTCGSNNLWVHGKGWEKQDEKVWDCHILSAAADGENCMESKTCQNHESHCYEKNDHWASCNASCSENYKWVEDKWVEQAEKVWNCKTLSCVADGTNCMDSRCCKSEGSTCFKKNDHWASCNATCSPKSVWSTSHNAWVEQAEDLWDCAELLPEEKDESADTTEAPEAETTEAPEAETTEAEATEAATTEEAADETTEAPEAETTEADATEAATTEEAADDDAQ